MSLIIKSSRNFTPPPEGLHDAVCVDVEDLGEIEGPYGKRLTVRVVWELDEVMEDGRRFIASKRYRQSLHEKSALYKDLKGWRGRPLTAVEAENFDLERVIGTPCQLLIEHVEKDGTVYGNVTAVTKCAKGAGIKPSGQYTRVQDRPERVGDGRNGAATAVPDDSDIPF